MEKVMSSLFNYAIGAAIGLFVGSILTSLPLTDGMNLKKECEKTLPRDKVCEMKFVPKVK